VLLVTIFCWQFDSFDLSQVTALGDTQYADNLLHKVSWLAVKAFLEFRNIALANFYGIENVFSNFYQGSC